jgi:hypothetical protein
MGDHWTIRPIGEGKLREVWKIDFVMLFHVILMIEILENCLYCAWVMICMLGKFGYS